VIDSHQGDIRSILNFLQFLSTKYSNVTLSMVQEDIIMAKKEGNLTSHNVIEGIFSRKSTKEKRKLNLTYSESERVINETISCGEFDRIINGISLLSWLIKAATHIF
jgi:hypothetical protein